MSKDKFSMLSMGIILLLSACQTVNQEVNQIVHRRKETPKTNPHKEEFIKQAQGAYQLTSGVVDFTIDSGGNFKLGDVTYYLYDAISSSQGIYVASTPASTGNKKVYTYHGILSDGANLYTAPFKAPSFEEQKQLTEKDTEYYWEVNTFQPENINWASGFSPKFATKV